MSILYKYFFYNFIFINLLCYYFLVPVLYQICINLVLVNNNELLDLSKSHIHKQISKDTCERVWGFSYNNL